MAKTEIEQHLIAIFRISTKEIRGKEMICIDAHEFVFAVIAFTVMITILIMTGGKW